MKRLALPLLLLSMVIAACGATPTLEPTPTRIPVTPIPDGMTLPLDGRFVREDDTALGIDILTLDYPANWVWLPGRLAFANTQQALDNLRRAPGFYQPLSGEAIGEVLALSFANLADDYDLPDDTTPDELLEAVIEQFSREEVLPQFSEIENFDVRAGEAALIQYSIRGTTVVAIAVTGWNGYGLISLSAPSDEITQYVPTLRAMADSLDIVVIETLPEN
jgi:hypothetical protein